MRPRENPDFRADRADVIERASVQPFPLIQNQAADSLLLKSVLGVLDDELGDFFRAEFFDELRADLLENRVDRSFPGQLAGRTGQHGGNAVAGQGFGFIQDVLGDDV
ncbi:MAG: hypothetical protein BWX84_01367 [Verrucomicrobia bacterium ADurb.Bin118]|nr:MAG: hypothetical protein BWX84_01367 [Verrucomicrobia bacterium ADurb.Bin118]